MKLIFSFAVALAIVNVARAQVPVPAAPNDVPPQVRQPLGGQPPAAQRTPAFVPIDKTNLASLADFTADIQVRAISLGVSTDELKTSPAAQTALLNWVREGGVVFLHTDAAELFGYETVEARQSTARLAGQLFGRARAAVPFGAHPLLWGVAARVDEEGQPAQGDTGVLAGASAVRTIYYQAQPGDCFVVGHPRGVPLLQIVEPAGASRDVVYAAAIAPYGRGWAIVTPNFVEPQRGDGALFATNLLRFAGVPLTLPQDATGGAAPAPPDPFVALPSSWVEAAASAAQNEGFDGPALAAELVAATPRPDDAPATVAAGAARAVVPLAPETEKTAPLAIRASERNALWRSLGGNPIPARTQILVLRARLALQAGDTAEASRWHAMAENLAPNANATKIWGGVLSAGEAADRTLASPARAALLGEAVGQWSTALGNSPRRVPADGAAMTPEGTLGGVPRELVTLWGREATSAARLAAAEPPLVTLAGDVVVRFYVGDASLRLALPAAGRLAAVSRGLGIAVDDEELLLFSTPEEMVAYRAARGGDTGANAIYGDVSGSKILMVSRPATVVFLPPLTPGGTRRPLQIGTSLPILIGRLHGQVLINSLMAGAPVPVWLKVGIESATSQEVMGDNTGTLRTLGALRDLAAVGRLLSPAQYEEIAQTGTLTEAQTALAEAQASAIVQYFVNQLGSGTLVEFMQRVGAGQDVSEALNDTAELDETGLFKAWSNAAFGA